MSLDLNKLANKLDEALSNETSETLTKFLNDKRMSNNKQSTYNLMWAIAILREDYHHCWRLIAEEMGCSMWKARYLYSRIKKDFKLKQSN
jgi:uncharacterized lipoprotein